MFNNSADKKYNDVNSLLYTHNRFFLKKRHELPLRYPTGKQNFPASVSEPCISFDAAANAIQFFKYLRIMITLEHNSLEAKKNCFITCVRAKTFSKTHIKHTITSNNIITHLDIETRVVLVHDY